MTSHEPSINRYVLRTAGGAADRSPRCLVLFTECLDVSGIIGCDPLTLTLGTQSNIQSQPTFH